MNIKGISFAFLSGTFTAIAGGYYNQAMSKGPASAVAAIAGSYPAVAYVVGLGMGVEGLSGLKVAGVLLSVGSGLCFSMA
ncbi:hypothetical protein TL16_g10333 [Triparma laevis f. inornata]|uniref:EamA domain-containing protein n=2 Tax=Triparma laevis TaxID=1534972 RepID=A0A9W7ASC8_9STRA|nr:hypothetical protein TrLO_g10595 [Triparma laevis f. longispina]GMH85756.1 hypothetical protein TL16_g10333 [Triparma laevis f. inornata]